MSGFARRPWLPTGAALALLFAAAALRHDAFASSAVVVNLFDDGAVLGLAALGSMLVIASGGIDLSSGAVVGLTSVLLAAAVGQRGVPPALAVPLVLALGAAFGAAMGTLIDALALPAFIVTLAGMFLARGLALWVHVESLPIAAETWQAWARIEIPLAAGAALDLSAALWIAAVGGVTWALRNSRLGRGALALGGDERTALYFGVAVRRTRVAVYALGGSFSAAAGVAYALYAGKGDSTAGVGLELDAIAAAVVGGTALRGGTASPLGAALGVLLFGVIQTLLIFEGVPGAGWARVALGAILLVFLALQRGLQARSAPEGRHP